jgi:hypothetical protein
MAQSLSLPAATMEVRARPTIIVLAALAPASARDKQKPDARPIA